MDYTGVEQLGSDVVIKGIKNFIPAQILDCGQSFRWESCDGTENNYKGVAYGRMLELSLNDSELILKNTSISDFESIWRNYFDLDRDYNKLKQLYANDETLKKATDFSPGLRLIKQDAWEMLISFILSQNSNIPRIKGMVSRLCESFGQKLPCGSFTFPTPNVLSLLSSDDLAPIKCGYRTAYILDAARRVSDGRLDLESNLPSVELRDNLMRVHGVGPKVADCVMLFGFNRIESYPLDVWMKRVMAEYYPKGLPSKFADTAGIAQQFLFHYIRNIS